MAGDRGGDFPARLSPETLAEAMPRVLIAEGRAERIARDWSERAAMAWADGRAPIPGYALGPAVRAGVFAARQARKVVRGLEGAESALDRQEQGLSRAQATRPESNQRRISRLLVVSADGADRFYRSVDRLIERHETRLDAIQLDCDEAELGEAFFGPGRRARAVLIDHKDAVTRFLLALDASVNDAESEVGETGEGGSEAEIEPGRD